MKLLHVALVRSSEAASDRFFQEVLGLARTRTKTVPPDLCARLFGREQEHRLVYYGNEHLQFEVFLADRDDGSSTQVSLLQKYLESNRHRPKRHPHREG